MANQAIRARFLLAAIGLSTLSLAAVLSLTALFSATAQGPAPTPCATAVRAAPTFMPPGRRGPTAPPQNTALPSVDSCATPSPSPSLSETYYESKQPPQALLVSPQAGTPRDEAVLFTDFSYQNNNLLFPSATPNSADRFNGALRLVPAVNLKRGQSWFARRLKVNSGFQITFRFRISNTSSDGADGIAFVLHNDPAGLQAQSSTGGSMGYSQIKNAVAIEFDIFQNGDLNDPTANHIDVLSSTGVNQPVTSAHANPFTGYVVPTSNALENGNIHTARITYAANTLRVYYDDNTTPVLTKTIDIATPLNNSADQGAWVGFTAATGGNHANHDILTWELALPNVNTNPFLTPQYGATSAEYYAVPATSTGAPGVDFGVDREVLDINFAAAESAMRTAQGLVPGGTITRTPNMTRVPVEYRAKVWYPSDLTKGPYPLAVILHGNHPTCGTWNNKSSATPSNRRDDKYADYTLYAQCPRFQKPGSPLIINYEKVPSYRGYDYIAQTLAKAGFIAISIDASLGITLLPDAITTDDPGYIRARGRLVLRHLEKLYSWNQNGGFPFTDGTSQTLLQNKIDFSNILLVGHSRGGEGVRAAYNLYQNDSVTPAWNVRIPNVKFKGIFEIASTNNQNARILGSGYSPLPTAYPANGVAHGALAPMCDGDVTSLEGVRRFDEALRNLNDVPSNSKIVFVVRGTNHNFYNTEWQISEEFAPANGFICLGDAPIYTATWQATFSSAQLDAARYAVLSFAQSSFGSTPNASYSLNFNPLYNQPTVVNADKSYVVAPNATLHVNSLEDFTGTSGNSTPTAVAITATAGAFNPFADLPHVFPQRSLALEWDNPGPTPSYFQINFSQPQNFKPYLTLDFRAAIRPPTSSSAYSPDIIGVRLSLLDSNAESAYILFSPSRVGGTGVANNEDIFKWHPVFQTFRIPLCYFSGVDLAAIRGIKFTFDVEARPSPATNAPKSIFVANINLSYLTGAVYLPLSCTGGAFTRQYNTSKNAELNLTHNQSISEKSLSITASASQASYASTSTPAASGIIFTLHMPPDVSINNYTGEMPRVYGMLVGGKWFPGNLAGEERNKIQVILSPSDLTALPDGAPVRSYPVPYAYGPFNKSVMDMYPQLQGRATWLVYVLQNDLRPLLDDARRTELDKALEILTELVGPTYWLDQYQVRSEKGAAFIQKSIEASLILHRIVEDSFFGFDNPTLPGTQYTFGQIVSAVPYLPARMLSEMANPMMKDRPGFPSAENNPTVLAFSEALKQCWSFNVSTWLDLRAPCLEAWDLAVQIRAEMDARATPKAE
jgi:hypothetical protein